MSRQSEEESGRQKIAFTRRLHSEKRFDAFMAKMNEYTAQTGMPPHKAWKYAAIHFLPLSGSAHEVKDLPEPLPPPAPPLGELDGTGFVDDAPPAEAIVIAAAEADFESMFAIDGAEVDAAWKEFVEKHMLPSRLLAISVGLEKPNEREAEHLKTCRSCKDAFDRYQSAGVVEEKPESEPPKKKPGRPPKNGVAKKPAAPVEDDDEAGDPETPDYSDLDKKSREDRELEIWLRLHKKVPKDRKAKPLDIVEWVGDNLDEPLEDIHPRDIPSRAALANLRTARGSAAARNDFIKNQWVKLLPSKADMGAHGSSSDRHATQHRLLDDFDRHYYEQRDREAGSVIDREEEDDI